MVCHAMRRTYLRGFSWLRSIDWLFLLTLIIMTLVIEFLIIGMSGVHHIIVADVGFIREPVCPRGIPRLVVVIVVAYSAGQEWENEYVRRWVMKTDYRWMDR